MKLMNILVGGPLAEWPLILKNGQVHGKWIGADRGNLRLIKLGIDPLVAIGDFDSMKPDEFQLVKQHVNDIRPFNSHKDDTDTELSLKVALYDYHAQQVDIYGATGGRLDHFLANLFMILEPRFRKYAQRIRLIDRKNTVSFYLPGRHRIKREPHRKYLSFVPLIATKLSLSNVEYPLTNHVINNPRAYVSNRFRGQYAKLNFDHGVVAVIQSRD